MAPTANLNFKRKMNTQELWKEYKKVKEQDAANEIFQNSFLKIQDNLHRLKDPEKVKAWMYRIVRNEIVNFYNGQPKHTDSLIKDVQNQPEPDPKPCCFDRFIDNLPAPYKETIAMVYPGREKTPGSRCTPGYKPGQRKGTDPPWKIPPQTKPQRMLQIRVQQKRQPDRRIQLRVLPMKGGL